jgi:hypothetical protein
VAHGLITIAYQSLPTLFSDLDQQLKATAEISLNESRLPIAFYGLSYLPLLVGLAVASRLMGNRKRFEFSVPMERFTLLLTLALIAISFSNLKAVFLVSILFVPIFIVYAILFRDRHFILPSIACLMIAGVMSVPFASTIDLFDCNIRWSLVVMASIGFALSATRMLDRLSWLIPLRSDSESSVMLSESGRPREWVQISGLILTAALSLAWFVTTCMTVFVERGQGIVAVDWVTYIIVAATIAICTIRKKSYAYGLWFWALSVPAVWLGMCLAGWNLLETLSFLTILSGAIGIAGYLLMSRQKLAPAQARMTALSGMGDADGSGSLLAAILAPLSDLATAQFIALVTMYYLPSIAMATITLKLSLVPLHWPIVFGLVAVYGLAFRNDLATIGLVVLAPVFAGIGIGQWFPEVFMFGTRFVKFR